MTCQACNGYASNHSIERGGYYARDNRTGLQVRKMRTHLGPSIHKEPQDVSEVQEPLLEHAKNTGKKELGG